MTQSRARARALTHLAHALIAVADRDNLHAVLGPREVHHLAARLDLELDALRVERPDQHLAALVARRDPLAVGRKARDIDLELVLGEDFADIVILWYQTVQRHETRYRNREELTEVKTKDAGKRQTSSERTTTWRPLQYSM